MVSRSSLPYRFHPEASREFEAVLSWYGNKRQELAQQFKDAVDERIRSIISMPLAEAPYLYGTRKSSLGSFPIRLVFNVMRQEIVVVAFAHTSRRPGYWRDRLDD